MKCPAIGRNADWPKSLLFYFDSVPTDDQMRYLHEVMQRACACMPETLRAKDVTTPSPAASPTAGTDPL